MKQSRRGFLATAALSTASLALAVGRDGRAQDMNHMHHKEPEPERPAVPRLPAILCKATGTAGIDAAYRMLMRGSDTLDAAVHVCTTQEDDPKDHSTGVGALPNAQGEVQLDACCFHGPTQKAAAVSCLSGLRNPTLVARALMENSSNALLVGSDAQTYALAHGFQKQDLLTQRTRQNYELWNKLRAIPNLFVEGSSNPEGAKSLSAQPEKFLSQKEFDLRVRSYEPMAVAEGLDPAIAWRAVFDVLAPASQAVYVSAIDREGRLSSACTSAGLPWRLAGVSSDVATIGAGCFVDPEVGSAGASGNAEANIRIAGAHTIIENMRKGMNPEEAGMDALRRIVRLYKSDQDALRSVEIVYYVMRRDGTYACVSLWQGDQSGHVRQYAIMDGEFERRTEDCVALFPCGPLGDCATTRAERLAPRRPAKEKRR